MNPPSQQPYERLYGVGLLDDLHNYFPALLYEPSLFPRVSDVLSYIQTMTRRRLDPYTVGASRYLEREGLRPAVPTRPVPVATPTLRVATTMDDTALTTAILQMLMRTATEQPPMTPVIVRPTEEQISVATQIITNVADDTTCAICQDGIQRDEVARKINRCGHTFHRNCIDTWFMTNVRCPVCRADIRDGAIAPSS